MGYKQWTAIVQLAGVVVVGIWLATEAGAGLSGTVPAMATTLLLATGGLVVFNIVGMIIVTILVTMVQQRPLKDEPADERDDLIDARSSRIGYIVTSALAVLTLVPLTMGGDPALAVLMLFMAPLAGGVVHAAAQLVYYRLG